MVTLGVVRAAPPEELETSALIAVLADDWGLDVEAVDYAAVGGGSYHWLVKDLEGTRSFVTADDLDQKPWLGKTRESAFDGLRRAFDTAVALRDSGVGFVVAPIPTSQGETVRRIGPRHTIALFPFVDGEPGTFGTYETAERAALLAMLADLHEATPLAASVARRIDLALPGREKLEAALQAMNQTWSGGPLSEPARRTLAPHASDVAELLALLDRLSADVATRGTDWVITHGEPHGGNVIRAGESYVLVDWDTVALAPRTRRSCREVFPAHLGPRRHRRLHRPASITTRPQRRHGEGLQGSDLLRHDGRAVGAPARVRLAASRVRKHRSMRGRRWVGRTARARRW